MDGSHPCQSTANVVLGLLGTILEERAQANDGQLSMDEIRQVIGQFMDAPGRLRSFYLETHEQCLSSVRLGLDLDGPGDRSAFEAKVKALAGQDSGALTLGRLQLVGLEAVRERLGARWEQAAERVRAVADGIVRKRLSAADSFVQSPEGDIVICFGELAGEEAWLKAKMIGQEIRERLLGCETESSLDDLEIDFVTLSEAAEVVPEIHDLQAPLAAPAEGSDFVDFVSDKLAAARQAMRARARDDLARLERRWGLLPRPINVSSGAPARFAIADVDAKTGQTLAHLLPIIHDEPEALLKVDLLALAAAASFLGREQELDGALLAVSVHASSAADGAAFNRFSSACAKMAPEIRERLILVLDDLPDDLSPSGLGEALRRLRGFARLHALKLPLPKIDNQHLQAARVPLVLVDYAPASALLRRDAPQFRRFIGDLRNSGARLLVDHVPRPGLVEPLLDAGLELWSLAARPQIDR